MQLFRLMIVCKHFLKKTTKHFRCCNFYCELATEKSGFTSAKQTQSKKTDLKKKNVDVQ